MHLKNGKEKFNGNDYFEINMISFFLHNLRVFYNYIIIIIMYFVAAKVIKVNCFFTNLVK
jgi:hypothetical protein